MFKHNGNRFFSVGCGNIGAFSKYSVYAWSWVRVRWFSSTVHQYTVQYSTVQYHLELGEGEVVQKHVPPLLVLDQVGQHEPELVPPVLEAAQLELALLNMAHYIRYAPD